MENPVSKGRFIGIKEAARLLDVSTMTLQRWDSSGVLRAFRVTPTSPRKYRMIDILKKAGLLVKEIKRRNYYQQNLLPFPEASGKISDIKYSLKKAYSRNVDYRKDYILGYPGTFPHKVAVDTLTAFLPLNPNNIGTHTRIESEAGFYGTQELEREAVSMISDLFNTDMERNSIDGYISSGGTEGNIMGLWILRNWFRNNTHEDPVILKTYLTHYSIKKAQDILTINKESFIEYNKHFEIDLKDLEIKIRELYNEGHKSFIIVTTIGYTVTGSIDNILKINELLLILEKELKISTKIHIDAAHGGFIYPFLTQNKYGFNLDKVMTISLDAHKLGLVPYSCGIFLCRKNSQQYIETDVDYIKSHFDDTLIGSRSGAIAAALWATIKTMGKNGYKKTFKECIREKDSFIKDLANEDIIFWYYTNLYMNIVSIEFSNLKNHKLPKEIERKYGLNNSKIPYQGGYKYLYKIVFMPHVNGRIIQSFINDVKKAHSKK